MDCCYVGEEGAVFAAMERLEKATDHLAQEKDKQSEESDTFLNNLVMEEVLAELKDIAQRDGISCECGSHQWRLEVHYASVELICAQCGSAMRINAGTMDDLNELCMSPEADHPEQSGVTLDEYQQNEVQPEPIQNLETKERNVEMVNLDASAKGPGRGAHF